MNNKRLENVKKLFEEYVENGHAAGASVAVFKDCKERFYFDTGYADIERGYEMSHNTIFRCFSMTKPITSVAVLILMERGIIDMYSPVSEYLPEFAAANMKVMDGEEVVPAKREILVRDLMDMTAGTVYPDLGDEAGRKMALLYDAISGEQDMGVKPGTMDFIRRIALQPLAFEPGTHWRYGTEADILGAVVEAASGMRFGDFLQKEIFDQLGMKDTAFYVPEEKKKRFAQIYRVVEPGVFAIDTEKHLGMEGYDEKPAFESGGAGLVSTVEDYGKFAMMLANGGTYDGVRILSPYTVEFMGTNQLDAQCRRDLTWETLRGYGYGNLCRVMDTPQCTGCSVQLGAFGWDGWTGNYFLIDPVENMVIMYVIQKCDGTDDKLVRKLLNAVYGALC